MEEGVVGGFGLFAEKEVPQLAGQCEGDHEVGRGDELAMLSPHPLGGGGTSALRAAFVMTAVEAVFTLTGAALALMHMPAHDGGAAVLQCPDGTVLHAAEHWVGAQIRGHKSTQRLDDRGHLLRWAGMTDAVRLTGQAFTKPFHELQCLLLALMGEVEVDFGRV